MCDIDKETRKERYATLRKMGYTRGWAQRARDFTNKRFEQACCGGHRVVVAMGGKTDA